MIEAWSDVPRKSVLNYSVILGNLRNVSENVGKSTCGLKNLRKRVRNLREIVKNVLISTFIYRINKIVM